MRRVRPFLLGCLGSTTLSYRVAFLLRVQQFSDAIDRLAKILFGFSSEPGGRCLPEK
jgi:hypothetical protein